jgi:glycosyltransferase involved in cell wall biosynthesis
MGVAVERSHRRASVSGATVTDMSSHEYAFTVFTPTYNRGDTLERVYSSLCAQTFHSFEWLVVDDGSTDGTRALIEQWREQAQFPVRYIWQENRGKHVAFNVAVREARGELFLCFDSDDACVPHALERFKQHWDSIPSSLRPHFSAVTALCEDQHGNLVGNKFPFPVTDSNSLEIQYRFHVAGEKWGFHRTDVLREFPFPEVRGTYVPESVVWGRIAQRYATRFVNDILRIYYTDAPSLMRGPQEPGRNALGGRLQHLTVLNEHVNYLRRAPVEFLLSAAHYARFSFHLRSPVRRQLADISNIRGRVLWALGAPAGWLLYRRDLRRTIHSASTAHA